MQNSTLAVSPLPLASFHSHLHPAPKHASPSSSASFTPPCVSASLTSAHPTALNCGQCFRATQLSLPFWLRLGFAAGLVTPEHCRRGRTLAPCHSRGN